MTTSLLSILMFNTNISKATHLIPREANPWVRFIQSFSFTLTVVEDQLKTQLEYDFENEKLRNYCTNGNTMKFCLYCFIVYKKLEDYLLIEFQKMYLLTVLAIFIEIIVNNYEEAFLPCHLFQEKYVLGASVMLGLFLKNQNKTKSPLL